MTDCCCRFGDRDSWLSDCGEILVEVDGRVMPGGGGSAEPCWDIGMGAKPLAFSKVPLPMPEVPHTLRLGAVVGQGENASWFGIGERPNGCCFRSPGDEYDDGGGLYGADWCWNGARGFALGERCARGC